jgi:hypothetical protein
MTHHGVTAPALHRFGSAKTSCVCMVPFPNSPSGFLVEPTYSSTVSWQNQPPAIQEFVGHCRAWYSG